MTFKVGDIVELAFVPAKSMKFMDYKNIVRLVGKFNNLWICDFTQNNKFTSHQKFSVKGILLKLGDGHWILESNCEFKLITSTNFGTTIDLGQQK